MKNLIIGIFVGGIIGAAGGFAAGILVFPYLFPPPEVNEQVSNAENRQLLGRGSFVHADPDDALHYGKGGVTVYQDLLHLEADFEVGPGPKYHVYLVPDANVTADTEVEKTSFIDLGRLKAFSGSQNYSVPEDIDLSQYQTVVIWCEQFGVLISPAKIERNT